MDINSMQNKANMIVERYLNLIVNDWFQNVFQA